MSDQLSQIYGIHAVDSFLQVNPKGAKTLYVQAGSSRTLQELAEKAQQARVTIVEQSRQQLDELCDGNHQGAILLATPSQAWGEKQFFAALDKWETPFLLVLDSVTDPHNLGACLRSADAAGVHAVIVPKDKAAGLTDTVRKVASGAAETTPLVVVTNLARTLDQLKDKGVWLAGAAGEAKANVYQQSLRGPLALVMGAEGSGLRRLTRDKCDFLIKIPMAGQVESLNVSVATGVILFEALRQRSSA